jgi:hypothetical protein
MASIKSASCFCGAVNVEVEGDPRVQGYCHCTSCRRWTAQPFLAYALWPSSMVRIAKGEASLGQAARNENLTHHFCKACGGSVMAVSSAAGFTDVFPMIIKDFEFQPASHVNYAERVIDMRDGLPKFRDMPATAGGSGEMVDE